MATIESVRKDKDLAGSMRVAEVVATPVMNSMIAKTFQAITENVISSGRKVYDYENIAKGDKLPAIDLRNGELLRVVTTTTETRDISAFDDERAAEIDKAEMDERSQAMFNQLGYRGPSATWIEVDKAKQQTRVRRQAVYYCSRVSMPITERDGLYSKQPTEDEPAVDYSFFVGTIAADMNDDARSVGEKSNHRSTTFDIDTKVGETTRWTYFGTRFSTKVELADVIGGQTEVKMPDLSADKRALGAAVMLGRKLPKANLKK